MRVIPLLVVVATTSLMCGGQKRNTLPAGPGEKPFDVSRSSIPLHEIHGGGPAKDGIPSLTDPKFVTSGDADKFLSRDDLLLGVFRNGVAKAYPIKILNWHEAVNDTLSGEPILVSW